MRKTLLLLLSLSLGLLGSGSNDLFAKPGYYKADPVLSNIGSNVGQSWFTANTVFAKFKAGKAVAPPTIIGCQTVGYRKQEEGNCTALIGWDVPTSPDGTLLAGYPIRASDSAQLMTNPATFPVGLDTIIYIFTNADGQTACRIPIQVTDETDPTITDGSCGDTVAVAVNPGFCFADNVPVIAPDVADSCSTPLLMTYTTTDRLNRTISDTIVSGDPISDTIEFKEGFTTVTFNVTDQSGNTNSCQAVVQVTDNNAPVLGSVPANQSVSTDPGQCFRRTGFVTPSATDNCGTPLVTWVITDGNGDTVLTGSGNIDNVAFPTGTNTVTYTATDASGNTDTDSFTYTVTDTEAPVINGCPSDQVFLRGTSNNGTGDCNALVNVVRIPGNDNCTPNASLVYSYVVTDSTTADTVATGVNDINFTAGLGTYIITYTLTDLNDNTSLPCTFRIRVVDNEAPIFTSASLDDISLGNDSGTCSNDTLISSPNATDNCGTVTLTWMVKNGSDTLGSGTGPIPAFAFPVGLNTVVWTITDAAGLRNFDTVLVTVADTTAPTIDAGDAISVNTGEGCRTTITRTIFFADNCAIDTVVENSPIGSFTTITEDSAVFTGNFPVDVEGYLVTFTVTDVNGNTDTTTLAINVNDTINPTVNNFANIIEDTDGNECDFTRSFNIATDFNPADNCGIESTTVIIDGPVGPNDTLTFGSTGTFSWDFAQGVTTVTVVATDNSGNDSSDVFTVTVTDDQPPVVFFQDTVVVNIDPNSCTAALVPLVLTSNLVEDNCTGDDFLLSNATNNQTNLGDTATAFYNLGFTTVIWTITDMAGNTSTKSVVVWVRDVTLPGDTPNDTIRILSDINLCSGKVKVFAPNSLDSCGIKSVQYSINDATPVTGTVVDNFAFPVGTSIVEWFTTDNNDNTRVDTSVVIVTDAQAPTITTSGNVVLFTESNACTNDTTLTFSVSDNCEGSVTTAWTYIFFTEDGDADGDTITGSGTTITRAFPVGNQPSRIIVNAMDQAGNTATAQFTVTVIDNKAPLLVCPGDATFDSEADFCGKRITIVQNSAVLGNSFSDNCGIESITGTYGPSNIPFNPSALQEFELGTTPVTITITDVNGNTKVCTFNITVVDAAGPNVSNFPTDTVVTALANECSRQVYWTEPTASDPCTGNNFTITRSHAPGFVFQLGTTTVTYTFRDQSGNTSVRSFTVRVIDTQRPVISSSPENMTLFVSRDADDCSAIVIFNIAVDDNCDAENTTQSFTFPSGTRLAARTAPYTNTIIVTDQSGNSDTATFTITVRDTTRPEFTEFPVNFTTCNPTLDYDVTFRDNCEPITVTYTPANYAPGNTVPAGSQQVTVTLTDASGNQRTQTFTVNVLNAVTTANAGVDQAACFNGQGSFTLIGNPVNANNQEVSTWAQVAGNSTQIVSANNDTTVVNYNAAGIYTFRYTISNGSACPPSFDEVTVFVNQNINANAGQDQNINTTSTNLNGNLPNGASGLWSRVSGLGDITDASSPNTAVTNLASGQNIFRWVLTIPGCTSTADEVTINVTLPEESPMGIPKAFTPGGDGENDDFNVADFIEDEIASVKIFNRWGTEVFSTTTGQPWDGKYEGKDLPMASYYYVIELKNGKAPIKGYITIIR